MTSTPQLLNSSTPLPFYSSTPLLLSHYLSTTLHVNVYVFFPKFIICAVHYSTSQNYKYKPNQTNNKYILKLD